jgi:hypothetical protein
MWNVYLLSQYLNAPTMLKGTYHIHPNSEETLELDCAYAYPSIQEFDVNGIIIIEPKTGILRHIIPTADGYEIKTSTIGESGGTTELQPLHFTGAVDEVYDGTEPVEIPIPSGGGWETLLDFTLEEDVMSLSNIDIGDYTDIELYAYFPSTPDGSASVYVINGIGKGLCSTSTTEKTHLRAYWHKMHDTVYVGTSGSSNWEDKLGLINSTQQYMNGISMRIYSNNTYPLPAGARFVVKGLR